MSTRTDSEAADTMNQARSSFAHLASLRHELSHFCGLHLASLNKFWIPVGDRFDRRKGQNTTTSSGVATNSIALKSLLSAKEFLAARPLKLDVGIVTVEDRISKTQAFLGNLSNIANDGSFYYRCFQVGACIEEAPSVVITAHIEACQSIARYPSNGVCELWSGGHSVGENSASAYLAFRLGETVAKHSHAGTATGSVDSALLLWCRAELAKQIVLQRTSSPYMDADHLAWSLAYIVCFDAEYHLNNVGRSLVTEGLQALFAQQDSDGGWNSYVQLDASYAPTARCSVYETLATLLECSLGTSDKKRSAAARFFREQLRRHLPSLRTVWGLALSSRIEDSEDGTYAWRAAGATSEECGETAAVFYFAQVFRRFVSQWTFEVAIDGFEVESITKSEKDIDRDIKKADSLITASARKALHGRGVHDCLKDLFGSNDCDPYKDFSGDGIPDHDVEMIPIAATDGKHIARSAVLYGPPGTSKTTTVETIAAMRKMRLVRLGPSDFVSNGLDGAYRTCSDIFDRLDELDRVVVLFDECEELMLERKDGADVASRFFTTSLLPRLKRLWDSRRLLFFVVTNRMEEFDPAITRNKRFDARICVGFPSVKAKIARLCATPDGLSDDERKDFSNERTALVNAVGSAFQSHINKIGVASGILKFSLMTYDEVVEQETAFKKNFTNSVPTVDGLSDFILKCRIPRLNSRNLRGAAREYFRQLEGVSLDPKVAFAPTSSTLTPHKP